MPTRCARCGAFAGRGRSMPVPGEWVSYLESERDLPSPVGRLSMPLCTDCYPEVEALRSDLEAGDATDADRDALLGDLDLDALVDEGT
ncbi:MAG: hypothetical protein ABEI39_01720 [Halobacteriales archaeon]